MTGPWLVPLPTLQATHVPSLLHSNAMERRHRGLMAEWQLPLAVTVTTWLVCHVYSFIRYNYFGGSGWESITMWVSQTGPWEGQKGPVGGGGEWSADVDGCTACTFCCGYP